MQLLEELDRRARNSVEQEQADRAAKYQNARTAALLAFFFGLRVSETVRLTLSDMVLGSTDPYLWIRRSKRGRSRRVYAQHVPPWVLEELKRVRNSRFNESNDPSVPLLVGTGEPTQDAKEISRIVIETIEELGLRGDGDVQPVTFHTLRHEYANRLLVLGVPLLEIAKSMGHASSLTTVGSYLHAFDYLQQQQLDSYWRNRGEPIAFAYGTLGAHLGVVPTAVLELAKRRRQQTSKPLEMIPARSIGDEVEIGEGRTDRRMFCCSDVVGLLAFRLGIQ